jgi:hypothetical protein
MAWGHQLNIELLTIIVVVIVRGYRLQRVHVGQVTFAEGQPE